jgi:hypothetical protein
MWLLAQLLKHIAIHQRKGKCLILPMEFARAECARACLPFHVSCCIISAKPDVDIGRLITDYSHPVGGSMMFPDKKILNASVFGHIKNPTAADICQIHANAVHGSDSAENAAVEVAFFFPGLEIHPR